MIYWQAKLAALLLSRRFKAVLVGLVVMIGHELLGLDEKAAHGIALLIASWILGDSLTVTDSPRLRRLRALERDPIRPEPPEK